MKQNQVWMNFTGFVTSKNVMDSTLLRKMLKFIIDIRPKEIKKKEEKFTSSDATYSCEVFILRINSQSEEHQPPKI